MRIEGPAALAVQISFIEDWFWATDRTIPEMTWEPTPTRGEKKVLIVPSGPADRLETAALMFLHAINSAQKRIWIASPYVDECHGSPGTTQPCPPPFLTLNGG